MGVGGVVLNGVKDGVGTNLLRSEVPVIVSPGKVRSAGVGIRAVRGVHPGRQIGHVGRAAGHGGSPEVTAGLGRRSTVGTGSVGVAASGLVAGVEGLGLAEASGKVVGVLDVLRGVIEGLRAAFSAGKRLIIMVDVVNKRGASQRHGLGVSGHIVVVSVGVGAVGAMSTMSSMGAVSSKDIVRGLPSEGLVLSIHADGFAGVGEGGFTGMRERHVCLKEVGVKWFKRVLVASCE